MLGFVLILLGSAFYINGPERFVNFEKEYLGGWRNTIETNKIIQVTWISYTNATQNFVANVTFCIEVMTNDEEISFHILNEEEFTNWENIGNIGETFLSESVSSNFEHSFIPEIDQPYYLMLENTQDTTNEVVVYLWWEGEFLRFNYDFFPIYIAFILIGIWIWVYFKKLLLIQFDNSLKTWCLPKVNKLDLEKDREKINAYYKTYEIYKKILKMFFVASSFILLFDFLYKNFSNIMFILGNPPLIRPEHIIVLYDLLFRTFISRAIWLSPLILGFPVFMFIIRPRAEDLSMLVKKRWGGYRQSKKQDLISKKLLESMMSFLFPWQIIILITTVLTVGVIFYFLEISNLINSGLQSAFTSLLLIVVSIWLSYQLWLNFEKICQQHNIGNHARETWKKKGLISSCIAIPISWIFWSLLFLITASSNWESVVNSLLFNPVSLLNKTFGVFTDSTIQSIPIFASFLFLTLLIILGFSFFILFPYIYKEGTKGILGVFLVFTLTFLTETILGVFFQGTISIMLEPLGLISPVIAAVISQIAGNRYNKIVRNKLLN